MSTPALGGSHPNCAPEPVAPFIPLRKHPLIWLSAFLVVLTFAIPLMAIGAAVVATIARFLP